MFRVLVTGGSGLVGWWVALRLQQEGREIFASYHHHPERLDPIPEDKRLFLDLKDPRSIENTFHKVQPDILIHAAAMPDLMPAENDPQSAFRINVSASQEFAGLCTRHNTRMFFFSTDQVFDGEKGNYRETDPVNPVHVYGKTKAEAERLLLASEADVTVLRLALAYGKSPSGSRSGSEKIIRALQRKERIRLFTDEFRTPIYIEDAAAAVAEMVTAPAGSLPRLMHLAGPTKVSRYEFGMAVAEAAGEDSSLIDPALQKDVSLPIRRPRDLSMDISLLRSVLPGCEVHNLQQALEQLFSC
ncbi:MAG TPA: SDR family oxidoreductase [Phycisphaeraceae bacterium]|nr:SDR family oxidoreductase [Phycisphaeraceae bacterium]